MSKRSFILLLSIILSNGVYAQTFKGVLIEITKDKDEIKIPYLEHAIIYVETETQKIISKTNPNSNEYSTIPYEKNVNNDGSFEIDISKLDGNLITLYFSSNKYAHIVIRDIPRNHLDDYIRILPAIKNIWKPTCGPDCFTVNKQKTYKRKRLIIKSNKTSLVFERKIINVKEKGPEYIIPIPFNDTWPLNKIYYYEYKFE